MCGDRGGYVVVDCWWILYCVDGCDGVGELYGLVDVVDYYVVDYVFVCMF